MTDALHITVEQFAQLREAIRELFTPGGLARMQQLLKEYGHPLDRPMEIYCDG